MRLNRSRSMINPTTSGQMFRDSRSAPATKTGPEAAGAPRLGGSQPQQPGKPMAPPRRVGAPGGFGAPGPGAGFTPSNPGAPTGLTNPLLPGAGHPSMRPGGGSMFEGPQAITGDRGRSVHSMYDAPQGLSQTQGRGRVVGQGTNAGVGMFTTSKVANPYQPPMNLIDPALTSSNPGGDWRQQTRGIVQPQGDATDRFLALANAAPINANAGDWRSNTASNFGEAQSYGEAAGSYSEPSYESEPVGTSSSPLQAEEEESPFGWLEDLGDEVRGDEGSSPMTGTSTHALQASGEGAEETGHVVNASAGEAASEGEDYAGAVYNEHGQRVDPSSGLPYGPQGVPDTNDAAPGYQQYDGSVDASQYGEDDASWLAWLRENGYDVVDEGGTQYIRGEGGRGDSGSYHGDFNNPEDWTGKVQGLRGKFEDDRRKKDEAEASAERQKAIKDLFGLLPDAPQLDKSQIDALVNAREQRAAFQAGQGNQAALNMAARGRLGAGATSGMIAQSSNDMATEGAQAASEIRYRAEMSNFEAQRQAYAAQIGMIQQFIQSETDQAAREMANKQLREVIKLKAGIDRDMMEAQLAQQERAQNFGFIGDMAQAAASLLGASMGSSPGSGGI